MVRDASGCSMKALEGFVELLEDDLDPVLVLFVELRDVWVPGLLELSVR